MNDQPLNVLVLPAYYQAGMAVTALEYGLRVQRLSLRIKNRKRERPQLEKLGAFLARREDSLPAFPGLWDYITTLMAGSVGRLIGLETFLGLPFESVERHLLARALMTDACQCNERETDQALAIVVGYLSGADSADATKTLLRFWRRASDLLRQEELSNRLHRLAAELIERREMSGKDVVSSVKG